MQILEIQFGLGCSTANDWFGNVLRAQWSTRCIRPSSRRSPWILGDSSSVANNKHPFMHDTFFDKVVSALSSEVKRKSATVSGHNQWPHCTWG